MIVENIKTAILWVLILSSIVLTWLIWTYEPEYKMLQRDETEYIESEQIGEERSISSLVMPSQIIVHQDDTKYWMQPDNEAYKTMMDHIKTIDVRNIHSISTTRATVLDLPYVGIELIFPDLLHVDWLSKLFSFSDDTTHLASIDRIVLFRDLDSNHGEVSIVFISTGEEKLFMADTGLSAKQLESFFTDEKITLTEVDVLRLNMTNTPFYARKYVPTDWISINYYTYFFNSLQQEQITEAFKRALFNDPEYIKHYFPGNRDEEVYTDGSSMLNIVDNGNILRYNNPALSSQVDRGERSVVDAGIEFINGHSGWTGQFQLEQWRETSLIDSASFRMYVKGLPIMGTNQRSQEYYMIELTRNGSHITEYNRPIFDLNVEEFEGMNILLPPFEKVVEEIYKNESIQIEWVEDVKIGHYMEIKPSIISFEPSWFVKERGRWVRIEMSKHYNLNDVRNREVGQGGLE